MCVFPYCSFYYVDWTVSKRESSEESSSLIFNHVTFPRHIALTNIFSVFIGTRIEFTRIVISVITHGDGTIMELPVD